MNEYPDEFIRKMRLTGLISLRGAGRFIDINRMEDKKLNMCCLIMRHIASLEQNGNTSTIWQQSTAIYLIYTP